MVFVRSATWFLLFILTSSLSNGSSIKHRKIEQSEDSCIHNSTFPRLTDIQADNVDAGSCACAVDRGTIQCLPTVILIGIGKGGTSEMGHWLGSHPQVQFASKEMQFFDKKGNDHPKKIQEYMGSIKFTLTPQDHASGIMTAEKSPAYAIRDCAASWQISKVLPSTKLLIILRNPVERANSGFYQHCDKQIHKKKGIYKWIYRSDSPPVGCSSKGFDNFIETAKRKFRKSLTVKGFYKAKDKAKGCLGKLNYFKDPGGVLSNGLYATTFEEYYKHFNRSQLHIMFSEDFVKEPLDVMAKLETFIGLQPHQYHAHKMPTGFYTLDDVDYESKGSHPHHDPPSDSAKEWLTEFYAAEISRLANLLPDLRNKIEAWSPGYSDENRQHSIKPMKERSHSAIKSQFRSK